MNSRSVAVDHLVELVDAADTLVCQHESSSLQSHFSRQGILHNCCSQTDAWKSKQWYAHNSFNDDRQQTRRPPSSGVLRSRGESVHVGEQLRLRHTRITHQQHIQAACEKFAINFHGSSG